MQRNELRLLVVAGAMFALIAAVFCTQKLLHWQQRIERRKHEVELLRLESDSLLAEAPQWLARRQWISEHQPSANEGALEANAELDMMVNQARQLGLSVQSQQLQEAVAASFYQQYGVSLTVKGELEKVAAWMHRLLAPSQFRVVPLIKITPDKDSPSEVVVVIQFWRWYAPVAVNNV